MELKKTRHGPWSFCNSSHCEKFSPNKMWSGLQRDSYRLFLSCVQCSKVYFWLVRTSTNINHLITPDEYSHINALTKNKLSLNNTLLDKNRLSRDTFPCRSIIWMLFFSVTKEGNYSALHQLRTLTAVLSGSWTILPRIQALREKKICDKNNSNV